MELVSWLDSQSVSQSVTY